MIWANRYRRLRALVGKPILLRHKAVVQTDSMSYCEDPIFVIGCHRSGTSLLRRMLDSHQSIACPPETYFLKYFFDMLKDESARSGFAGILAPDDIDPTVLRHAFSFHEAYRIANDKPRWADKTPSYVDYLPELERWAPKRTQFIVIKRDPYDIAISIFDRNWFAGHHVDDPLANAALFVKEKLAKIQAFVARGRTHVVDYEALVREPEASARAITDYLNEDYDARMITPWASAHNFGTEDPIARSSKRFEASVGNWRRLEPQKQALLAGILGDLRAELGYTD